MFKSYDLKIRKILEDKPKKIDWKRTLRYHKLMISRIQHERLIHLMVMIFVGIVMSLAFFVTMITKIQALILLDLPLLVLFVGYLFHYRFLENTAQSWYGLEDKIEKHL